MSLAVSVSETAEKRREWFVEKEAMNYAQLGLVPVSTQCIGFGVPAVFAEGGTPDTVFIADIYEHVSFLGDCTDKSQVRQMGAKCVSESILHDRG